MTDIKQQLLQEGFITQVSNNQLEFYHNKYKTTIKDYSDIPFKTLIGLLKAIQKLDRLNFKDISNFVTVHDDNLAVHIEPFKQTIYITYDKTQDSYHGTFKTESLTPSTTVVLPLTENIQLVAKQSDTDKPYLTPIYYQSFTSDLDNLNQTILTVLKKSENLRQQL
jgi:hypothetical protein